MVNPSVGNRQSQRGKRGAFTLIEVLVVIAILAVICAFLLPVLRMARERPRTTLCTSHLRQLHAAFALYASDYDGYLPPYQNRIGTALVQDREAKALTPIPENGLRLVESMQPYTTSRSLWFCPNDPYAGTDTVVGGIRHQYGSYLVNSFSGLESVTGESTTEAGPQAITKLNRAGAASIVLLTDNLWLFHPAFQRTTPYSHNGRFLRLFFDGHVRSIRFEEDQ
jgi:prepilin-type N-terminal cleavage/methylation domain-containing protein/prepilin-type processing-associated H-X9-DG protein